MGRRPIGNPTLAVVGEVTVRQMNDLFGKVGLIGQRYSDGIGNHIIDECRTHTAGEAQEIDLDRGGTTRGDRGSRPLGETHQINQDVNSIISD